MIQDRHGIHFRADIFAQQWNHGGIGIYNRIIRTLNDFRKKEAQVCIGIGIVDILFKNTDPELQVLCGFLLQLVHLVLRIDKNDPDY